MVFPITLKEMIIIDKEKKIMDFIAIILASMFLYLLFLLYGCCRSDGANNDNQDVGSAAIEQELRQAKCAQRVITEGIDAAEAGIKKSTERTGNIESFLNETDRIIADCKQIIRDVQERSGSQAATTE